MTARPSSRRASPRIRTAIKVLNESCFNHKMHQSTDGAVSDIISLFEVCEVDLSKNLDQIIADEKVAADDHETVNKENEIVNTMSADDKELVQCF